MNAFTDALLKLGPMRLFAALGLTAVVAAAVFALVFRVGGEEKALLFSNVEMGEAGEIASRLEAADIPYELKGDGTTIMVPRSKVLSARLMLSEDGLPSRGSVGYEIFDRQDALGATQFQQNINRLRALEGELARTIASIQGVERARVHLVLPEKQLFAQERDHPTASIVLSVAGGALSAGQVRAVRNLVASAVPGLAVNRVTIADDDGRLLAAAEDDASGAAGAEAMDERRVGIEERLRKEVQNIVESVVGPGAARVQVSADVDFNRVTQTSQTFDPEGRVARETTSTEESSKGGGPGGGSASASRNVPDGAGSDSGAGGEESERTEENVRYEISNTTKTEIIEGGRIKRLSVAVAVDGVTTPGAEGQPSTWAARDAEELARITALVKSAVGFDEARGDKVEVVNLKFARAPTEGAEAEKPSMFSFGKDDIMRGVEILAALIASMAVIFFVLRPLVAGMINPAGAPGAAGLLTGPGGAGALAGGAGMGGALAPPLAGALPAPAG
ncbi:MAG: flagellar basal-body MS-ring/collar protein FliF, partial [Hyphomonadaceae bacterium]|nr:flagellar basal-body MS-ring/collar protein FliF [Hyphomonadaceae bacterium]